MKSFCFFLVIIFSFFSIVNFVKSSCSVCGSFGYFTHAIPFLFLLFGIWHKVSCIYVQIKRYIDKFWITFYGSQLNSMKSKEKTYVEWARARFCITASSNFAIHFLHTYMVFSTQTDIKMTTTKTTLAIEIYSLQMQHLNNAIFALSRHFYRTKRKITEHKKNPFHPW